MHGTVTVRRGPATVVSAHVGCSAREQGGLPVRPSDRLLGVGALGTRCSCDVRALGVNDGEGAPRAPSPIDLLLNGRVYAGWK